MLTLYHNDMSACAQKVRFVLAVKQLEWQSEELNLRQGDQQRPEYLKINPKGWFLPWSMMAIFLWNPILLSTISMKHFPNHH